MLAQTRDNPAFWVQYAHVQACALQNAAPMGALDGLTEPEALALMRKIAEWPALVARAARLRDPNRIALYLTDLADVFHAWRQSEGAQADGRSPAKSALSGAVAIVIATGLGILGIEPAEEMR